MSNTDYLTKLEILEKRLKTIKAVLKEAYNSKDRKKTNKEKDEPDVSVERPDTTTPQSDLPHYGFSKEEDEAELEKAARARVKNPSARRIVPKRVYPKHIQHRNRIFRKRIIQANRGITSFWRSEDQDKNENINYFDNGQWSIDNDKEEVKKYGSAVTAAAGGADGVFQAELSEDTVSQSENDSKYHILRGGEQVTAEPVTLKNIIGKYGSVQRLEGSGHILKRVKKPEIKANFDPTLKPNIKPL